MTSEVVSFLICVNHRIEIEKKSWNLFLMVQKLVLTRPLNLEYKSLKGSTTTEKWTERDTCLKIQIWSLPKPSWEKFTFSIELNIRHNLSEILANRISLWGVTRKKGESFLVPPFSHSSTISWGWNWTDLWGFLQLRTLLEPFVCESWTPSQCFRRYYSLSLVRSWLLLSFILDKREIDANPRSSSLPGISTVTQRQIPP